MNRAVCIQNYISVCINFGKGVFHSDVSGGVNIVHINIDFAADFISLCSTIANKNIVDKVQYSRLFANHTAIIASNIFGKGTVSDSHSP